jgi:hypothetical protein
LIAVTLTRFAGTSGRRGVDQQFSARAESCFYAYEELNFHHEHLPARAGTPQSGLEVRRVTQRSSETIPTLPCRQRLLFAWPTLFDQRFLTLGL